VWNEIRARAGVADEVFMRMDPYPDEITYRLVGAASEVLDTPADTLLREFGRYWTRYTMVEGYGALLSDLGGTLHEALVALDAMHARVALLYPALKPPTFKVSSDDPAQIRLEYRSRRPGLAPMVIGLVEGMGERYGVRVAVTHLQARDDQHDHDLFDIRITGSLADGA
jgi:hypothetical protein